jgi:hypothetical protein
MHVLQHYQLISGFSFVCCCRAQLPALRREHQIMELPDLLRFVGPQWTTEHTRKALLHLHDEGEIIFRQHFPCVLLDPTWLCSTVMGRILSGLHPPIRNARTDLNACAFHRS